MSSARSLVRSTSTDEIFNSISDPKSKFMCKALINEALHHWKLARFQKNIPAQNIVSFLRWQVPC